ncbi:MAG: Bifunctional protein HldE [Phycisphaerae bacterium]|nr:Bifunctional protein HldE [Phycisphaerae bacterium]
MNRRYLDKILTDAQLTAWVERIRAAGQRIVLCHGCFDIVHPGHIRHLEFARRHGEQLLVSISGDAVIDKAAERPYIPQELRAENLAALEMVDAVFIAPGATALEVLQQVQPDVYVKGEEYQGSADPRFLAEQQLVEHSGGRVIFSSGDIIYSSTALLQAVGGDPELDSRRLAYVCQRHEISRLLLETLISRFAAQRVIVVGDIIVDRYIHCDALAVAAEAPVMSLRQLDEHVYIGGAGVVARHLAALGANVTLMSSLGKESYSERAATELQQAGVELLAIHSRPALPVKSRYLVETQKIFKVEQTEQVPLDSVALRRLVDLLQERAGAVSAVIFCDFGYGVVSEGLLQQVLPALRPRVPVLAADVSGPRGSLLHYREVDLFCPTEREVRATLHNYEDGLSQVAWELLRITQARQLLATLGHRGLVAFQRPTTDPHSSAWHGRLRSDYLQALEGRAIDPLGCGDALLAGATLGLCAGASLLQAAYLGSSLATLEAAELGNIPIGADRLRRFLATRTELNHE